MFVVVILNSYSMLAWCMCKNRVIIDEIYYFNFLGNEAGKRIKYYILTFGKGANNKQ